MIKKYLPNSLKIKVHQIRRKHNWKGKSRIFCLSMQRSGTTSVGDFFKHFAYPTSGYSKDRSDYWSKCWYDGDFETIFKSKEFLSYQVFEDNPWWNPDFYKVLYNRFPNSKFILMYRNSDDWFNSMLSHSEGNTLGNTKRHCKIYRREIEFYDHLDYREDFNPKELGVDNLMKLDGLEESYKRLYELHNREVIDFFRLKDPEALFYCNLYDKNKWYKLGNFIGINVSNDFEVHSNQSNKNI